MIKRRNFIKMLPIGFLSAQFGGLVEFAKPGLQKIKSKIMIIGSYDPGVEDNVPIVITSEKQMIELYGKGSPITQWNNYARK